MQVQLRSVADADLGVVVNASVGAVEVACAEVGVDVGVLNVYVDAGASAASDAVMRVRVRVQM